MEFSDGMKFDLSKRPHIEKRRDGLYVVGGGMLIPIDSREEGEQYLREYNESHPETKQP